MPLSIPKSVAGLVSKKSLTVCTCWKIKRTDGTIFRFTDCNKKITLPNDGVYSPIDGVDASARRAKNGLEDSNLEFRGIISSSAITYEDLFSGKFDDAEVTEYLVDWKYAFAGPIYQVKYFVDEIEQTEHMFVASVSSLPSWLKKNVGRVYSRTCDEVLGGPRCKVDTTSTSYVFVATVSSVVTQKLVIDGSVVLPTTSEFFTLGYVFWVDGPNAGLKSEIKQYTSARRISFFLETPFAITNGQTFYIVAGCDKIHTTCHTKFNNIVNFQGFNTIPGTDKTLGSPKS